MTRQSMIDMCCCRQSVAAGCNISNMTMNERSFFMLIMTVYCSVVVIVANIIAKIHNDGCLK